LTLRDDRWQERQAIATERHRQEIRERLDALLREELEEADVPPEVN
jgi:hypothetical protein